jgi:hypothetical protein
MAQSGRERHRDRDPGRRAGAAGEDRLPAPDRRFLMTDEQRREIAECLRFIDEARDALERQENPANRQIIRGLRASADQIYDLLNELEETG